MHTLYGIRIPLLIGLIATVLLAGSQPVLAQEVDAFESYIFNKDVPYDRGLATRPSPLKRSDTPLTPRVASSLPDWVKAYELFRSNRVLWTYVGADILPHAKQHNISVQCALPVWIPNDHPKAEEMVCTDPSGGYGGPDSDLAMGLRRPDVSSRAWREYQLGEVKKMIDAGCTSLQQDNPWQNNAMASIVSWNGCYADKDISRFRRYLQNELTPAQLLSLGITNIETFDYRTEQLPALRPHWIEMQRRIVQGYYKWLFTEANNYAAEKSASAPITFSANIHNNHFKTWDSSWLTRYFHFLVSEVVGTNRTNLLETLRTMARDTRAFGEVNAIVTVTDDVWMHQRAIPTLYALGHVALAPWDVYVAGTRFKGDPKDFAPLFNVVRKNTALFDDYSISIADGTALDSVRVFRSQGTVTKVEPSSATRVIVSWSKQVDRKIIPKDTKVYVGTIEFTTLESSSNGQLVLRASATTQIKIGDAVTFAVTPSSTYFMTIRGKSGTSGERTLHIVNWSDTFGPVLVKISASVFPAVPTRIVTPESPTSRRIEHTTKDGQYVYVIPNMNLWTVLY